MPTVGFLWSDGTDHLGKQKLSLPLPQYWFVAYVTGKPSCQKVLSRAKVGKCCICWMQWSYWCKVARLS